MADVDCASIMEFLHMEIVSYICQQQEKANERELLPTKLEQMGYEVGQRLVERMTKDCPRFKDELDIFKFVCKDLWMAVYKKQIDNLRTNRHGTYVLMDDEFRFLTKISEGNRCSEHVYKYLAFPCGLIRGALANLGVTCSVTVAVSQMPKCKFDVKKAGAA